jgi:hypothetical protein
MQLRNFSKIRRLRDDWKPDNIFQLWAVSTSSSRAAFYSFPSCVIALDIQFGVLRAVQWRFLPSVIWHRAGLYRRNPLPITECSNSPRTQQLEEECTAYGEAYPSTNSFLKQLKFIHFMYRLFMSCFNPAKVTVLYSFCSQDTAKYGVQFRCVWLDQNAILKQQTNWNI